jgi:hypothetical protein
VIEQMDFLDIPGMRAGRQGAEQGKRTSADTLDEQMEIVKRGKVAYLFERYTEELQIQTLLLLSRGVNLEVTAQMKYHIDKWGRARYGEKTWPAKVRDEVPALFIGLTGIDEEFRNREEYAPKMIYESRLSQLVDALGSVMTDFGGKGKRFTNVYPIRYPGTWDTNQAQREESVPEKWSCARKVFLEAEMVKTYVRSAEQRWDTAMRDDDGGLSLLSAGIRAVTTAEDKQNQLQREILEVQNRLLQHARGWVVNPDANVDRERRIGVARRVLEWLEEDVNAVYWRVYALQETLSVQDGDEMELADCGEIAGKRYGDPLPRFLKDFLHEWASVGVPKRWEQYVASHEEGAPWIDAGELNSFARYLRDYLLTPPVFDEMVRRLGPIVHLKTKDEAARRKARRQYVRIILNDFVMNPGASMTPVQAEELEEGLGARDEGSGFRVQGSEPGSSPLAPSPQPPAPDPFAQFGLMASFVDRWASRLPQALALGGGEHVPIPPGNAELIQVLEPFEK